MGCGTSHQNQDSSTHGSDQQQAAHGVNQLVNLPAKGLDSPLQSAAVTPRPNSSSKKLTILHFNDVYNIEAASREPVGGAARFAHKVKSMAAENPLIVFSGDAFNPSMMSTITKGAQMVPVLNQIGVHVACVGNHDLDFGVDNMVKLTQQCRFPWLMANVLDKATGVPYGQAKATLMLDHHGVKVGVVGLIEEDWLTTLGACNPADMIYLDFVEEGRRLARKLKAEGAEVLIAVTHMRVPNDRKLAAEVPEFHLVMGGHDHHYEVDFIEPHANLMVKSGTDFRELTKVVLEVDLSGGMPKMDWQRISITSDIPEDPDVAATVTEFMSLMGSKMSHYVVDTATDLDGRFTVVRTQESNLGNFVCDVLRVAGNADIVLLNGGTLRSDVVHASGALLVSDFVAMLPMMDTTVVLHCTGAQVVQALENGVSQVPKLEGRFLQVSGIKFSFDASLAPGSRVVPGSVTVGGEPLQDDRLYKVLTKEYLSTGHDGFDVFKECKVLVDEDNSPIIPTAIRNHCTQIEVLNTWDPKAKVHRFAKQWLKTPSAQSLGDLARAPGGGGGGRDGAAAEGGALLAGNSEPSSMTAERVADKMPILLPRLMRSVGDETGPCVLDGKYLIKSVVEGRIIRVGIDDVDSAGQAAAAT